MREILFRGKQAYNDEWAFSEYPFGTIHCGAVIHDFIPETVGEYTGLCDKNGKKIFEGDIVYCISNTDCGKCVVIFEEGEFRLVPDRYCQNYTTGGGYHAIRCFAKEIVGNIHDNPELLRTPQNDEVRE